MSQLGDKALVALKQTYQAQIAYQEANLEVYLTNMVAIGEHSDLLLEIETMIGKIADLKGRLEALEHIQFNRNLVPVKSLND